MKKGNQVTDVKVDNKIILISVFKNCLNIMRDNEGLTGEKALRNLSYLLILKLLEPHLSDEIDIDNYNYDYELYFDEDVLEHNKRRLLDIVRFSNLSNEKDDDIPSLMKYLWDIILSEHPSTKNIFLKDKSFDIEYTSTYRKLINKLNLIDLSQNEYDILGSAYEEVIQDIMTGKVFGQFFTQPLIKNMMVKLIKPKIYSNGKIDTCGDPTMGTGGFLITYLQNIIKQAKTKKIKLDWEFIRTEGLYGKEIDSGTYQLAVSNMLISSGHMFEQLERGDSIRQPIIRKFDNILANPPFGIKGLKYDDFKSTLQKEYTPIKSDNAVSLFIQAIIYMLKINGKCAIVLPDGQDLFSKINKTLITVREYLLKTCDLKEIIYLPSGIFTYTSIKTCVFYFVKKVECSDVLEVDISYSKTTNIETKRVYKFTKIHQTNKIKFYDYEPFEDNKKLLVKVPIDKIVENKYSLNYTEYIKDKNNEEYKEGVVVKTLEKVCKFLPKSKRNAKYGNKKGLYPFFKSSIKVECYVDEPDYEEESLIIGDGGEPNVNYGIKFSTSDHCYILQNKNKLLLNLKYGYYYLYHNLDMISLLYTGVTIKNISKTNIEGIKIPIPSLERQQEIVNYLDYIYEKTNKTSSEKIAELKQLNEFCLRNQKIFGENVMKKLGEISIINPENMKSGQYTEINYIDIASVKEGQILELQKLSNNFPSRAKRIIKKGDILYSSVRPNLKGYVYISDYIEDGIASTGFVVIRVKETNTILSKYLYYMMTSDYISDYLTSKARGSQYPAVSFDDFKTIKIPIPSPIRQKEIVEYCEYNDTLIKQLEKEIENNKKQAHQCIKSIVKSEVKSKKSVDSIKV